jgi:hypothetical protein
MKISQLEMHGDKTGYLVIGDKRDTAIIKEDICKNHIHFGNFIKKEKKQDKWLGDQFCEEGLSHSVAATIKDRSGGTKDAIFELKGILEDYRMQLESNCIR